MARAMNSGFVRIRRGALPWAVFAATAGLLAATPTTPAYAAAPAPASVSASLQADPVAPFARVTPASGPIPVAEPLTVEVEFHNTLDAPVTDSLIVGVGVRLAPPATALTPQKVALTWYDATASTWRPVQLSQGQTALTGFLTVDGGLPSTGSIPAKGTAKVRLRIVLAEDVKVGEKLQFVAQGLIQIAPGIDPVPLMDGTASYVVAAAGPSPSPSPTTTPSLSPTPTRSPSPAPSTSDPLPSVPTDAPTDPVAPVDDPPIDEGGGGPVPQTGTGSREELAATGTSPFPLAVGGGAAVAAGLLLLRLRRTRGSAGPAPAGGEHR
ncbi:hypothetical protein [Streptomyces sp. NPDC047315]|uniref:hypothetical protein n=1 Tax=Streptomyces sp. NPDC047315 TaxID=3155142 RepID=UPI00340F0B42